IVSAVAGPTRASFVTASSTVSCPWWTVTIRSGGPTGESTSKRIEAGAFARSTPRRRRRSLPLFTAMSARARGSVHSLARLPRSAPTRRASSLIGGRDRVAHAASSASGATRRNLLGGLRPTLDPALAVLEDVDLLL